MAFISDFTTMSCIAEYHVAGRQIFCIDAAHDVVWTYSCQTSYSGTKMPSLRLCADTKVKGHGFSWSGTPCESRSAQLTGTVD